MSRGGDKITLDPQPFRAGEDWYVRAILPDGRVYPIDGFKTELEAKEWIAGRSKLWFREKGSDGDGIDVAEILARPVSVAPPAKIKPATRNIEDRVGFRQGAATSGDVVRG